MVQLVAKQGSRTLSAFLFELSRMLMLMPLQRLIPVRLRAIMHLQMKLWLDIE